MTSTSAYVFPFRPFRNLARTEQVAKITRRDHVTFDSLAPILDKLAPEIPVPTEGNWAGRLIALLAGPEVVFGEPAWITDLADEWTEKARPFVEAGKPIEFTILGFPFKAPVPLKTKRILPDFGELVMLKRLYELARAIGRIHSPGARIHIFAEGAFARINGMPQADSDAYFAALAAMSEKAGFGDCLVLHETAGIADGTPGFNAVWGRKANEIRARAQAGDAATVTALSEARPVTFHLNAAPGSSEDLLRRAYLGDASASQLRDDLERRTDDGVVRYRAFLEARDEVQLLERFAAGALGMTVSPRPGRLGVRPLPEPADVLPYHGVPVWNEEREELSIEYRWDMLTTDAELIALHMVDDRDPEPFLILSN
jgi:hypothetical protein